ncbi:MAG TPA: SufE family protein [Chlamydiales bacterium]|nr:SufE family protein [Chlamydiales bacterium]
MSNEKSKKNLFTHESFEEKIDFIKRKFQQLPSPTEKYNLLMDLGKNIIPIDPKYKTEEFLVRGCQSQIFLHAERKAGRLFFSASSDALISSGLASLLINVYSGENTETILNHPPLFLQELGIYASLSPNRSQGLAHIYLKMKFFAILFAHELENLRS